MILGTILKNFRDFVNLDLSNSVLCLFTLCCIYDSLRNLNGEHHKRDTRYRKYKSTSYSSQNHSKRILVFNLEEFVDYVNFSTEQQAGWVKLLEYLNNLGLQIEIMDWVTTCGSMGWYMFISVRPMMDIPSYFLQRIAKFIRKNIKIAIRIFGRANDNLLLSTLG